MTRAHIVLMTSAVLAMLALTTIGLATSQVVDNLQPRFGQVIVDAQAAESAGATRSEVMPLVGQLNKALELNHQAFMLSNSSEAQRRAALLAQVDQLLNTTDAQAIQLTRLSSQRSFLGTLTNYLWGAIAAVAGTIVWSFGLSLRKKSRIRRTFRMRASLK